MIRKILIAVALLLPSAAAAQSYNPAATITDKNPQPVKLRCFSGGQWIDCPLSGGGGGGGGDPSSTGTPASAPPLTVSVVGGSDGSVVRRILTDTSGRQIVNVNGSVTLGGTLPAFAATPTFNIGTAPTITITGALTDTQLRASAVPVSAASLPLPTGAATSANQTTGNTSLATLAGAIGTLGSTAPTTAQLAAGVGPSGNARGLATDTGGRLLPGQGIVASTRTTLTASTATLIGSAVSSRVGVTVQAEGALSANLFICTTQTTSCSATSYDFLIPSGATAGTSYTFLFATTGTVYAFSTGTPVVVLNSWTAQ